MIYRAPEEPLAIPDVALTPFLLERAAHRREKPALIDASTGRVLTYGAWSESVMRAAASLARRGFRKGDVFAIYAPNVPDFAIAFYAVSLLGGIVTTINPQYTAAELSRQLKDSGAKSIATTAAFVDKAKEAAHENGVRDFYLFGDSFDELLTTRAEPPAVDIDAAEDIVALPYSSGTTGLPKGVMLTHRNLVANVLQSAAVIEVGEDSVALGVLPFFHIYGIGPILSLSLYVGATVVTMPRFELPGCLEAIMKYRVSYAYLVPPIVLALAKSPIVSNYDLSSIRVIFSGAAPLSPETARAACERVGCMFMQGYGMTEASPVTHVTRVANGEGIGPPVPNTEAKIAAVPSGAVLGPREEGEICVRGPQVMKGYLNNPTATAAMIDPDGWLHTGDIGYATEDGNFFVVDRVKELIKYKGMQIAPAELESVLLAHPSIADAAVVPMADEEAGQVPRAFVVLRQKSTADEIMNYVADRVARYKRVRRVEFVDQIPRSPSGKILRRLLIERTQDTPTRIKP